MEEKKGEQETKNELEWIKLSKELATNQPRSFGPIDKIIEQPLLPVGAFITAGFVAYGLSTIGNPIRKKSQKAMWGRIVAQAVTVFIFMAFITKVKKRLRKEAEDTIQQ